jgi:hypothetical protein
MKQVQSVTYFIDLAHDEQQTTNDNDTMHEIEVNHEQLRSNVFSRCVRRR